ncbi:MAG: DUF4838 domain-containing protein [Ruminococcaceae bacterium]|nr:DUF4838 domain-containing protein [Oscillospiraceae bacterium]
MDSELETELTDSDDSLVVGCCENFDSLLIPVEDQKTDDSIYIDVKNGKGIITGSNPRSVLIAVYRYLKELGCRFIRPGKDNEVIPSCKVMEKSVFVKEKASYRHREVCIEGAVSYEHVSEMIDWIPKISMNGYYMQFKKPYGFFRKWYQHEDNPYMEDENITVEELDTITKKLEEQIAERDLLYYAVGHSWNSEPLGIEASYWEQEPEPPERIRKYLAMIDGKRGWYGGVPMNTNLCYSNDEVQELMTNDALNYCKEHPAVKYLVFWLADNFGNACQCEECQKGTFTDFYIQLVNKLDEKLTAAGLDTKIVFSLKPNTPVKERVKNKDRVTMMFCPIFRDRSETYPGEITEDYLVELPEFDGNGGKDLMRYFKPTERYVSLLKKWKDLYDGDSVIYDYFLIWDHYYDPGYTMFANTIATDIKNLKGMGLNGINSCQVQRLFFPTALPMISMAETLWNRDIDFEDIKNHYLTDAFGEDGPKLGEIMGRISQKKITDFITTADCCNWAMIMGEEITRMIQSSKESIKELDAIIEKNLRNLSHPDAVKQSWEYFSYYPEYARRYVDTWYSAYAEGDFEKTKENYAKLRDYIDKTESVLHRVLDGFVLRDRLSCLYSERIGHPVVPKTKKD